MSEDRPLISVITPVHDMENGVFFLERLKRSLEAQTFKDFELVITREGRMAENTNAAIKKARGRVIKILYMDDYLYSPYALQHIAHWYKTKVNDDQNHYTGWMASGCIHDDGETVGNEHMPRWNEGIKSGMNTIGSPSVIAFENDDPLLFDENLSWMLDVELYSRLEKRYGLPHFVNYADVAIGLHKGQMTHKLTDEEKLKEAHYVQNH